MHACVKSISEHWFLCVRSASECSLCFAVSAQGFERSRLPSKVAFVEQQGKFKDLVKGILTLRDLIPKFCTPRQEVVLHTNRLSSGDHSSSALPVLATLGAWLNRVSLQKKRLQKTTAGELLYKTRVSRCLVL